VVRVHVGAMLLPLYRSIGPFGDQRVRCASCSILYVVRYGQKERCTVHSLLESVSMDPDVDVRVHKQTEGGTLLPSDASMLRTQSGSLGRTGWPAVFSVNAALLHFDVQTVDQS